LVDKEQKSRQQRREVSLQEALQAISGKQAFQIFRYLAINKTATSLQIAKTLNLSRKVFYSNLKDLKNVRIVRKQKGVYSLSILGEIIADSLTMPERAYRHKFSVEVCEAITSSVLTPNQFKEFVNTTIYSVLSTRNQSDRTKGLVLLIFEGYF
jgi:DNA-binding HxlR family transcriptional regulator